MSAASPWDALIQLIVDGENVEAAVANRSPAALARRTQYLYDLFNATALGEALFIRNVPIEADAVPGHAVYFDDDTGMYKRALAAVEFVPTAGWYTIAKSSYAIGLVYTKSDTQLGTIVSLGTLRDFDLSSVIEFGSATTAGPYYLSMQTPGMLVQMKPPVGIYILYNNGDGTITVTPTPKDMLEDHIHYKYNLTAAPAGDHNCVSYFEWLDEGKVHRVVNPDPNLPGWLPADHEIFNGLAPEGAKFGYNMAQHDALQRVWPPMPLESAHIEANSHTIELTDARCPIAIIDANGLWWTQDCYGAAPWAPEYPGCIPDSSSSSSLSSSSPEECECEPPIEYLPGHSNKLLDEKSITLWFTKMVFKTDSAVVTSLAPCSVNSPIEVLDCEGEPGSTGRLCLSLDLSRLTLVDNVAGYKVIKGFGADSYNRGPVVAGLKAGAGAAIAGIGVEGTNWALDAVSGLYRGDLRVGLQDNLDDPRDYQPSLVALNNVREEYDNLSKFFYLVFPGSRLSSVRGRIEIPRVNMPADAIQMKLWFWFVGRSAGVIPKLTATYRRYSQPTGVDLLPSTDSDIVIGGWTPGLTLAGGDYAEAETPFFDVAVADTVFFTLGSDGTGPTEGFGIMRVGARVELKP